MWLAAGRPNEAAALLRAALGLLHPDDPQRDPFAAALCEVYLAVGDISGAEAALAGSRAEPPRPALPRRSAQRTRCAGLVAAASGDAATAVRRLAEALAAFERHDLPFEAARTAAPRAVISSSPLTVRLAGRCDAGDREPASFRPE